MPRKKCKRLSDEEIRDICGLYATGDYTHADLSRRLDISCSAISVTLKRNGQGHRSNKILSEEETKEVCRLFDTSKYSQVELSKKFGVSRATICYLLKRHGRQKPRKKLTSEEQQEVYDLYSTGDYTQLELSNLFEMPSTNIWQTLVDHGYETQPRRGSLSDAEVQEMYRLYETGEYSRGRLAKVFSIGCTTVATHLNSGGYPSPEQHARQHTVNETFFDKIDNQDKAYVLGLLYSDGCNHSTGHSISISLQIRDIAVVEAVRDLLSPHKDLYYRKPKNPNHSWQAGLTVYSVLVCRQLARLGCIPKKSLVLEFPSEDQVPNHLLCHFMRGCFDGDGHIGKSEAELTGAIPFIEGAAKRLDNELGIDCRILTPKRTPNIRVLRTIKKDGNKLLDWIYKDATISMERKHYRYLWRMAQYSDSPLEWK